MKMSRHPKIQETLAVTFRALRYRNYRLFFISQSISVIGYWLTRVATSWLVYRITGSPFWLGMTGFASQIPTFLLVPFAGVLVDRLDRHRILVTTQALLMIQPIVLSYLAVSHQIAVWHVMALGIFQGLVNAFDIPARQSFVADLIERKKDLGNAIALNSTSFNAARLIGPSIAGIIIAVWGEGFCFLIDALSYVPVLIALFALQVKLKKTDLRHPNILHELREGVRYAFGFAPIRALLTLVALISLLGMCYVVLLPVFARDVFHGGPAIFGFLTAASGLGALTGALYLASRKNLLSLGRHIVLASILGGSSLVFFSISKNLPVSFFYIYLTSFGIMLQMATCNTILQTIVDDDKRARVMRFYTMAFLGMAPCGSLLAGSLADRIGAPFTIAMGGLACIAAGLMFAREVPEIRSLIHPIYVRKGILPEIASAIRAVPTIN